MMILTRLLKPAIIFLVLVLAFHAHMPVLEILQNESVLVILLIILSALIALWLVTRLHFLLVALVVSAAAVINMPRQTVTGMGLEQNAIIFSLLVLVGLWIAHRGRRGVALLVLIVGSTILLPPELTERAHVDADLLEASLAALLLTPIIDIFTTKRERGISPRPK